MSNHNLAIRSQRKGLPVAISLSIESALRLIEIGKVEQARIELEDALRYATAVSNEVMEHVGLDSVRPGRGFPG